MSNFFEKSVVYVVYLCCNSNRRVINIKLSYNKKAKDPIYYAQIGIRNGKKTTTRNVKSFGKHSELLKKTDDPLAYVKEEIKKMNEEHRLGKVEYKLTADFNEYLKKTDEEFSSSTQLNIGYFFIQYIINDLSLKNYFKIRSQERKITFDCYTIFRFLTYARILDPKSKFATWNTVKTYYEQPDFDYQHILRYMDLIAEDAEGYLTWLYKKSNQCVKRDTSVLYYDCTNYYFECEREDEEYVDEVTGEVLPGLRRYGVSKENRPNPIVQMGLFMDRNGIPITMSINPGNTNEQTTAIPLESEVLKWVKYFL